MAENSTTLERAGIAERYKWNAESAFPSRQAWEEECTNLANDLAGLLAYKGQIAGSHDVAAEALAVRDALMRRLLRIYVYASIMHAVDTRDQRAAEMEGRAAGLYGQTLAVAAFIEPELVLAGEETLQTWVRDDVRLNVYGHYFDNLVRRQAHIRSSEVEELLGMLADPFRGPESTAQVLSAADLKFPPARSTDGTELEVTDGTFHQIMALPDREARRTAWEGYHDTFLGFKNAFASNLATSIRQGVFLARARRHTGTLEAALFDSNLPPAVFHNLIAVYRENLPTWHRYWAVRRRILGVDTLHPYDVWAPLAGARPPIAYEQAVDMISAGLAPLGEDYVATLRRGCLEERWVDVYPTAGKIAGAFSSGAPGLHPFIVMGYDGTSYSLSTLAHELGHSMHSYLVWQNQPVVYSDYSIFIAEVASNFHQALVRGHLLRSNRDPAFQLSVIEEAMNNFHRYFFIMPTLARFELVVHERAERGQGFSADSMIDVMADMLAEGYGDTMQYDRERVGVIWATFLHLFTDYYVFQYATGISAANALAQRVLEGATGAAEDYLKFLKAGSSLYPLDALKLAGVDLNSPEPVRQTFRVLSGLVDRLEELAG